MCTRVLSITRIVPLSSEYYAVFTVLLHVSQQRTNVEEVKPWLYPSKQVTKSNMHYVSQN